MNIWIDFINTPQVSFFLPFMEAYKQQGHDLVLTCRDSGNTVDLLDQQALPYTVIGSRVGRSTMDKLQLFPRRIMELWRFIRTEQPDIAVSHSSFYQPVVARMCGVPCLYTNDNEHAKGNVFGFLFAQKVFLPQALKSAAFTKKWPLKNKVSFYPGVKEAVYLSRYPYYKQQRPTRHTIYFRPEPWSAQYYRGAVNFFDEILIQLSTTHEVVILPRDADQARHYSQAEFDGIKVALKAIPFREIWARCKLFIGAGGSMGRELAVLQVPVISIYQADLLEVDRYLVDRGALVVDPNITYDKILEMLTDGGDEKMDWSLLEEGKGAYKMIMHQLNNLVHA